MAHFAIESAYCASKEAIEKNGVGRVYSRDEGMVLEVHAG